MPQPDFRMTMDNKTARKLLEAMRKATFNKLTPAQVSAVEDLFVELEMGVGGR